MDGAGCRCRCAGWLSLAAFLNLAQVIVAYELASTTEMLPWSLVLFGLAALMLLMLNLRMRGNIDYVIAALWALVAVYVKQSGSGLPGAQVAAWVALGIAALLVLQTVMLRRSTRRPAAQPGARRAGNGRDTPGFAASVSPGETEGCTNVHPWTPSTCHRGAPRSSPPARGTRGRLRTQPRRDRRGVRLRFAQRRAEACRRWSKPGWSSRPAARGRGLRLPGGPAALLALPVLGGSPAR